jgi:hypothetical protein
MAFDHMYVATASAASNWSDWKIVHRDEWKSATTEPLIDRYLWKEKGILSVYIQANSKPGVPSELCVFDFMPVE